ncbi:hypothetical protein [Paenibacillus polymyxa]|uniref:hypothetical protein n=1 Tax=Paenibacillus polymyxa TaxID=1406 RepID=UPI002ED475BE|nr:hypothetical protein [Paenibacillus polymyxa]
MKKKLLVGLLTVVACFTLGSTSFAASATTQTSNTNSSKISSITPFETKYVTHQEVLPKSSFPDLASLPMYYGYNQDGWTGTIPLRSVDGQTGYTWTVTYAGYVNR